MSIRRITVVGGGNGAHTLGALGAVRGFEVKIWAPITQEAESLKQGVAEMGGIEVLLNNGSRVLGRPQIITDDPSQAIPGSQLIIFVLPAFAHKDLLLKMAPYLDQESIVGAMPSRSGFEFMSRSIIKPPVGIFGLQTLPWACRIREYGKQVEVLGTKNQVSAAADPSQKAHDIFETLELLLGLEIIPTPNMLTISLGNVGQIVHPGIMYGLFRQWNGKPFPAEEIPLFYQGVTGEISGILDGLSREVISVKETIEEKCALDLSGVVSLQEWLLTSYQDSIEDKTSLQSSFNTNKGYKGLKAPVRTVGEGKYIPDFASRYLTEDVPYGLIVTRALAQLARISVPVMDEVITAVSRWMGREYLSKGELCGRDLLHTPIPQNYGIKDLTALKRAIE